MDLPLVFQTLYDVHTSLQLLCYARDDDHKHVFEVTIEKEKFVAALKKAIKEKKSQLFREVDADLLVLWNVSIPHGQNVGGGVERLNLVDDEGWYPLVFTRISFHLG
jgi:hypothetical protein